MNLVTSSALAIQFHHVCAWALSNPGLIGMKLQHCRIVLGHFRKHLLELCERQRWKQHPENHRRCRWWKLMGPLLPNDNCVALSCQDVQQENISQLVWLGKGGRDQPCLKAIQIGFQKGKGITNSILLEVYYQKTLQSKAMLVCWGLYNFHPLSTGHLHLQQNTTQRATYCTWWCCLGYSLTPSNASVHFDIWLLREYFSHRKT